MKKQLIICTITILTMMVAACTKSEEVAPEVAPDLVGKWTIKTGKNLSTTTLTAKANSTIEFTKTNYTVSQTQPFANYKNPSGLTEYIKIRNSTYKVLAIDDVLPLIEADLKLFFGATGYQTPLKNISAVVALYKKDGIKYVATLDDASAVASDPSVGTITVDIPAFGIVNFTTTGFAFELLDFGLSQDITKTTFVAKLPALRGQILLGK